MKLPILHHEASVDNKEKNRRHGHRPGEGVLDRGVFRKQLRRQIRARDVLVMRWEGIPLQAEGADPKFSTDVDLTENERKEVVTSMKFVWSGLR